MGEFIQKYDGLPAKARESEEKVAVAGRVTAIRHASKKLVFMDLTSEGQTIQVLSELKNYGNVDEQTDPDAVKIAFQNIHTSLRRGDIIGKLFFYTCSTCEMV